jgi:hypothetical protein
VCIGIITPTHYSGIRYDGWKHFRISQPIYLVFSRPGLFSMTIEAMDGDDAKIMADD